MASDAAPCHAPAIWEGYTRLECHMSFAAPVLLLGLYRVRSIVSFFSENTSKSDKLQIDFGSEESSTISKILFKTSAWIDIMKLDRYRHPHACNATAGISTNDKAPMVTEISNDWKHGQGLLNLTK